MERAVYDNSLIDWEKVKTVVNPHFDTFKSKVEQFLAEHPHWGAEVILVKYPPCINLEFWLRPQAYPGRRVVGWGQRAAAAPMKAKEAAEVASFVGVLQGEVRHLRLVRGERGQSTLRYKLKPYYVDFPKSKV